MGEENIRQEFRLKNIDKTKNYFLEDIEQNELMSRKHKKVFAILNYTELFLVLACSITECISISAFSSLLMKMMMNCFGGMFDRQKAFSLISSWDHCHRSLPLRISDPPRRTTTPRRHYWHSLSPLLPLPPPVGIPIGIASSAIGLKICPIAAGIKKKYNSIIKKRKNKNDRIVFLAKSKLNSIEVSISKALIDSNISHDEFVLINYVLKEYDNMKEEKKLKEFSSSSNILVYL